MLRAPEEEGDCRPVPGVGPSCRGWEGEGSESTGLRMDVGSGTMLCGLRLNVGHTSAGLQKRFRKALAESREYLQLKYWSDYIICGALQANLFAAFSICDSVSMVSRLVRDGIFKPNRQSLKSKS